MRLFLIRHAQSVNNAAYAAATGTDRVGFTYPGRVPDPPLSELGHRQAGSLAEALRDGRAPAPLTHLYSSLTMRAVQTAAHLAEALALPVILHDAAHEVGGLLRVDPETGSRQAVTGHSIRQLQTICPRAVPATEGDNDLAWHGGFEAEDAALPRAARLLAALRASHGDTNDRVGVVTHQFFGQFILAILLGIPGPPWRRFRIDNTAHVAIDLTPADPRLDWVNRCDHLRPDEITN